MAEQVALQQIAELLAAQTVQVGEMVDQKLNEMKASQDARFDAQDARFDAIDARFTTQDARFDAIETRMDQKFAAQDARFDAMDVRHQQFMETLQEVVHTVGEQIDQLKADIIRENRVLAEQFEGRKISSLYEESQTHKATLGNHEIRITELEKAVS